MLKRIPTKLQLNNISSMAQNVSDESPNKMHYSGSKRKQNIESRINLAPKIAFDDLDRQVDGYSGKSEKRMRDKSDVATCEKVMNLRIRTILHKMINSHVIDSLEGCISTGKEGNVYYATGNRRELAIKIFKAEVLDYKDRSRYMEGEFRLRNWRNSSNSRKMVAKWAEKEMRNLIRIYQSGISCPEPLKLNKQVLVMQFLGRDGIPFPKLKDVTMTDEQLAEIFSQLIDMMRILYRECKLVHADLSEYNLLVDMDHKPNIRLYMIDVSQAVEHEHPNALRFLRQDCSVVLKFFERRGLSVPSIRSLFEKITSLELSEEEWKQYQFEKSRSLWLDEDSSQLEENDDDYFKEIHIPRALHQVEDVEGDLEKVKSGHLDDLAYSSLTGMKSTLEKLYISHDHDEEIDDDDEFFSLNDNDDDNDEITDDSLTDDNDSTGEELAESENEGFVDQKVMLISEEEKKKQLKEFRKENKKKVKEENREKRKNKVPKHIKKMRNKKK